MDTRMNFKITWKSAGILLGALALGGFIGALAENEYAGLPIVLAAVLYLARDSK